MAFAALSQAYPRITGYHLRSIQSSNQEPLMKKNYHSTHLGVDSQNGLRIDSDPGNLLDM